MIACAVCRDTDVFVLSRLARLLFSVCAFAASTCRALSVRASVRLRPALVWASDAPSLACA